MSGPAASGLTLAVTSSTGVISLALGTVGPGLDGAVDLAGEITIATDRRHAEEIGPRLQELLDAAGAGFGDLDRLVVDVGPGRFTGLRVGLATVRALAFALDLPVIGLTSLAVLANDERHRDAQSVTVSSGGDVAVTAVIDARRSEVFQQTFAGGAAVTAALVGSPEELAATARGLVIGDGVDRYADHYRAVAGLTVLDGVHPRAATMLAMSRGDGGRPGTEVQPRYLREPDATPNIKTRATA